MSALEKSLLAVSELAYRRALLDEACARDPAAAAIDLEDILERAVAGSRPSRDAALGIASWIAGRLERGDPGAFARLHAEGVARSLLWVSGVFDPGAPRRIVPPRGRLAEVCISPYAEVGVLRVFNPRVSGEALPDDVDGEGPAEAQHISNPFFELTRAQRTRLLAGSRYLQHPDPVFVRRMLDKPWFTLREATIIAARRPTSPAIALAVATRDRWLQHARIQFALATNPFTPVELASALLLALPIDASRAAARRSPVARALLEARA